MRISHVLGRNYLTESFLPFKVLYILVRKINLTKKITRNGISYKIIIRKGIGIVNLISDYEEWFHSLLPKIIDKEDAIFVDIGANVGQTMLKVLSRYPKIGYYGIEPNKHCADYLRSLSAINKFDSVKIFECALSDSECDSELLSRYADDLLATTTHSFRKFTRYAIKTNVRSVTGDVLLKNENLPGIAVIKIDIEGGESKAIDGLLDTIRNYKPYIICEILPLKTEDEGVTHFRMGCASRIFEQLNKLNYICMNAISGNLTKGIEDLSPSLESCNYLFIPEIKAGAFLLN